MVLGEAWQAEFVAIYCMRALVPSYWQGLGATIYAFLRVICVVEPSWVRLGKQNCLMKYLITYLMNYVMNYLISYLITYLINYLMKDLMNYSITFLMNYLMNYLMNHLIICVSLLGHAGVTFSTLLGHCWGHFSNMFGWYWGSRFQHVWVR